MITIINKKKNGLNNNNNHIFVFDLQLFSYRVVNNPYNISSIQKKTSVKCDISTNIPISGTKSGSGSWNLGDYSNWINLGQITISPNTKNITVIFSGNRGTSYTYFTNINYNNFANGIINVWYIPTHATDFTQFRRIEKCSLRNSSGSTIVTIASDGSPIGRHSNDYNYTINWN